MTPRTHQALVGATLAALIGLPAGLVFGRSATAGATAQPAPALAPTSATAESLPHGGDDNASALTPGPATTTAPSALAPSTTALARTAPTATATTTAATPTTAASPPTTAHPVDVVPAVPAVAPSATLATTAPVVPSATLAMTPPVVPPSAPVDTAVSPTEAITTQPEVELTDPDMLGREISTEPSMLAPGQIDRISWIATPSVRRALVTVTVRFMGGGNVLAEYSADVRFVGRVGRAGSVRATVPDGATAIEIEWLSVGGPVDVHDIDVTAVETAPPAPYDQP